jgi:HAD superfamily hydrolase (TIGR01484 family)
VRLVASDLDGTLLRTDGTVSARTAAAVAAAERAGIPVVLVTARPPRWVDELADQVRCHAHVVCSNGAFVYQARDRRLVAEHAIGAEEATEVVRRLRAELDGAAFSVERGLGYGHEAHYPSQWPEPPGAVVARAEELVAGPVAKINVRHTGAGDHWETVTRVRAALDGLAEVTSSGAASPIELTACGVTKATTVARLAGGLDVAAAGVLAVGDMPNDLPLLEWAGLSAAPPDAHPAVLARVDRVTARCDEDGVALLLEALVAARS